MLNNLEKMIFLEMTNKSMRVLPSKEYLDTYNKLSESDKVRFASLSGEIHHIWSAINSIPVEGARFREVHSIGEYDEKIARVDEMIMKCSTDFAITLKREITPAFKGAVIGILGRDFYDRTFRRFE